MSFSFAGTEGQAAELPAVCDWPRLVSGGPTPLPHCPWSYLLWGLPFLSFLGPFFVSLRHSCQLLALKRNLFISCKNKPSHVLFLMGFKCLFYKRKVPVKRSETLEPHRGSVDGKPGRGGQEKPGLGNLALAPRGSEPGHPQGERGSSWSTTPCGERSLLPASVLVLVGGRPGKPRMRDASCGLEGLATTKACPQPHSQETARRLSEDALMDACPWP